MERVGVIQSRDLNDIYRRIFRSSCLRYMQVKI